MQKIVKADERFERLDMPRDEAIELVPRAGPGVQSRAHRNRPGRREDAVVLPAGRIHRPVPRQAHSQHRPHRQRVQAALRRRRVLERRRLAQQLQRLYATAFFDKKELDAHLEQLAEAKRRDHRVLGKQLELFTISQTVGSGLILWLPKGAIIRQTLEDYIKGELRKRGYEAVYTPNIGHVELYEISGHFPYYSDSQFPPIEFKDGERYLLKPMNCPHHIMIYQAKPRSYRDLPVRLAEFGTVYRFEQSGELSGMTRVRGFTQDDAHIFCTEEQVADEFRGCLEMTQTVLASLGMNDYRVRLGFRDPKSDKYVGSSEVWDRAEAALKAVCESMNLPRHVDRAGRGGVLRTEGRLRGDRLHRPRVAARHRAARLQPAEQGAVRPGIHRGRQPAAPAGDDPPGAARLAGAVRRRADRALRRRVSAVARAGASPRAHREREVRGLRPRSASSSWRPPACASTGDYRGAKLNAKIRDAQVELIPYMFVVGEKDRDAGTVAVRDRLEGDLGTDAAGRRDRQAPRGNRRQNRPPGRRPPSRRYRPDRDKPKRVLTD